MIVTNPPWLNASFVFSQTDIENAIYDPKHIFLKSTFNKKEFESFITETNLQIEKLKTNLKTIDNIPINRNARNKILFKESYLEVSNLSYRSTSLNEARSKKKF